MKTTFAVPWALAWFIRAALFVKAALVIKAVYLVHFL